MKALTYLGHGYNPDRFHPGYLEVFYGPMKAKKSGHLLERVDAFNYSGGLEYIAFKPENDTRSRGKIVSRMGSSDEIAMEIPAFEIPPDDPYKAKGYIKDIHGLIVFDEVQLFSADIVPLVESLLAENRNIVLAGLNLNFRGEAFGSMSYFINHAEYPRPLFSACAYKMRDDNGKSYMCCQRAQFTQKLIDGEPAPYNSDIVVIEAAESFLKYSTPKNEKNPSENNQSFTAHEPITTYEPRCRIHHTVPGRLHNGGKK